MQGGNGVMGVRGLTMNKYSVGINKMDKLHRQWDPATVRVVVHGRARSLVTLYRYPDIFSWFSRAFFHFHLGTSLRFRPAEGAARLVKYNISLVTRGKASMCILFNSA